MSVFGSRGMARAEFLVCDWKDAGLDFRFATSPVTSPVETQNPSRAFPIASLERLFGSSFLATESTG